jgi:hypothetical protein
MMSRQRPTESMMFCSESSSSAVDSGSFFTRSATWAEFQAALIGLLIWWAIPAVNVPMEASRSARCSACSACRSLVGFRQPDKADAMGHRIRVFLEVGEKILDARGSQFIQVLLHGGPVFFP